MAKVTTLPEVVAPNGDEPVIIISGGRAKRARFDRLVTIITNVAIAARDMAQGFAQTASQAAAATAADRADVSGKAADVTTKAADVSAKAADVTTKAAQVSAAKNAALAASEASGNIKFYDTKALANAALAGLPDQQIIEVLVDESRSAQVTRYRKEGGAYAFKRYMPMTSTIYIDSQFGNNANDGLTADTPLQTLAAAITLANGNALDTGRPYTVFSAARGSIFYEPATNFSNIPWSRLTNHGQGERPIVRMTTSPFVPGAWINHPTYTKCWYQDVDMLGPQGIAYLASGWVPQANMWHLGAWDEAVSANTGLNGFDTVSRIGDSYVQRVLNGDPVPDGNFDPNAPFTTSIAVASQSALYAMVDAWPNTITAFPLNGDNGQNWEPRNGTASRMRIVWHPKDDSNPNTNGRTLRITDYRSVFQLGKGMDIDGWIFACNGNKDMLSGYQRFSNADGITGPATQLHTGSGEFTNVDFIEHAVHGPVVNGMSGRNINAVGSYMRSAIRYGGYTLHNFRSNNGVLYARGYVWMNIRARRFGCVFGSHGNGAVGAIEHRKSDAINVWAEDGDVIMIGGATLQGAVCENVNARDIISLGGVGLNDLTFINSEIIMRAGVPVTLGAVGDGKRLRLRSTHVDASRSTSLDLPTGGTTGTVTVTADKFATLDLENSTVRGTLIAQSALRNQTHLKLRKSYLGVFDNIQSANEIGILGTIDRDAASVLECARTSDATVVAAFGASPAGLETTVRRQTWTRTLTAADFVFQAFPASYTASSYVDNGDGSATVTTSFNYGNGNLSRYIKIAGANAGGTDYLGRCEWLSNSTLKVTPVPTGASSGTSKAITFGFVRPKLYRNPVTAWISSDGQTLLLADTGLEVQGITPGTLFNVGSPAPASVPAPGVREVQSVATTNVAFTGSIAATTLTVTAIASGAIVPGPILTGAVAGTRILSQISSTEEQGRPGGLGTYLVDTDQAVASTAMTGTPLVRLTLTKAIPWLQKTSSAINGYRPIATPTSGTGRTLKTVTISWGFQVQQRFLSVQSQPQVAVTFAEGGGFTATQTTSGTSGIFSTILTGARGYANLSFDANGSSGGLGCNVFDYEGGWWNQAFGLAPGDTLTLTSEHEITPWRLAHNAPVELAGYSPVPTSLVAQRSIGYRPSRGV